MSEPSKNPFELVLDAIRAVVREEVAREARTEVLTAEQLAEKLKVPVSWVYEQSRLGNIPTIRLGKYVRFNLSDVLESQNKKESAFPLTRVK
jgi:excisionase family DNA binding protein